MHLPEFLLNKQTRAWCVHRGRSQVLAPNSLHLGQWLMLAIVRQVNLGHSAPVWVRSWLCPEPLCPSLGRESSSFPRGIAVGFEDAADPQADPGLPGGSGYLTVSFTSICSWCRSGAGFVSRESLAYGDPEAGTRPSKCRGSAGCGGTAHPVEAALSDVEGPSSTEALAVASTQPAMLNVLPEWVPAPLSCNVTPRPFPYHHSIL